MALWQSLGPAHLVGAVEEAARVLEQFAIGRMIHRLDADQSLAQPWIVRLDVLHQFGLGGGRPDDQPFVHVGDRLDDAVEVLLGVVRMARPDVAGLGVYLMGRRVGFDTLFLHVFGVELEDSRFVVVDPDDGVSMRHSRSSLRFQTRLVGL